MPAIKSTSPTKKCMELALTSNAMGENNDCSVKAVAVVCNVSYAEAWEAMAAAGRPQGDGATIGQMKEAVKALGFEMVPVAPIEMISAYPSAHQILKNVTTHHPERFNKVWADGNHYLLFTRGHVAAVVDGVNHDWTKGTAKRVTSMYKVKLAPTAK